MTCRNEENNVEQVLTSLEKQTIKPSKVVIVDDASTDKTYKIIEQISKRNQNWMLHHREKNDERYSSIVNAMKQATEFLESNFDFLMVLDGDTVLESQYIERIVEKFDQNSKLGIAGGSLKIPKISKTHEYQKLDHNNIIFGCNRIYSKQCWYDINQGKILNVKTILWDSEHSVKAQAHGYEVKFFPDITSESLRIPTIGLPAYVNGILHYQCGYSPPIMIFASIKNLNFEWLAGYLSAWSDKRKKIDNEYNMKIIKRLNDFRYLKELVNRYIVRKS